MRTNCPWSTCLVVAGIAVVVVGCGGGAGSGSATGGNPGSGSSGGVSGTGGTLPASGGTTGATGGAGGAGITTAARTQAATTTANTSAACVGIQPFYWEIGDGGGSLVSGTASMTGAPLPAGDTLMLIASASKWIFGAYVVELRGGALTANDVAALTMRSGYTNLRYGSCLKLVRANQDAETVHDCFAAANLGGTNQDFDASAQGTFVYNGGHFQWLADSALGLGPTTNATLRAALMNQLGTDLMFTYDSPQMAAGIQTSGQGYAGFLRRILTHGLKIADRLGSDAVCTNPNTCTSAKYTPIPSTESWHYSLGHWVEDDPNTGDGAFSSPGAFGFYPWIDAARTTYGVLARQAPVTLTAGEDPVGVESVLCGRKIRKAWFTAVAQ